MDRRWISGGDDDHRLVARERPRCHRQVRVHERAHVPLVRRGEHVGARAVLDLRAQLLRSGEVEGDRRARVLGFEKLAQLLERVAQRGGGEYRQLRRGEDRAGQRHALTCRVKATICQAYFTEAR